MIQPGMLLQGYLIGRKLGKGGFAQTFEVDDNGTPKVLKVLLTNYPKAISLFQREAEVLSKLRHPGIPKVDPDGYFTFCIKGNPEPLHGLVMEKIDGINLQEWLNNNQQITQAQAINWLKQLVEILQQIHHQHYFHRDIKLSNIMLKPDDQLVLIDFGAVREVTETYLGKLQGKEVTGISSPGYTPPEQSDGEAVVQSDFFALGRTMVHLLTGKHPLNFFKNAQTGELIWRDHATHVSESFAVLIDDLMATFPGQRPQNTQIILQRLETVKCAGNLPKQGLRRNCYLSTFGFAALLMLLGFFGLRFGLAQIAKAYNDRGVENYLNLQQNQALSNFNLALTLDPNCAEAYYNRGLIYEALRDFDKARADYRIAAKKGIHGGYNKLARLYILNKEYKNAIALLEQGMKQRKISTEMKYILYVNLGWVQLEQGRYPEAKKHLQMAINLESNRAAAYCLIAQVLETQSNQQEALLVWKSCHNYASESNPDESAWIDMAEKRLTKTKSQNSGVRSD